MARLVFNEVLTLGLTTEDVSTDWQISLNSDFSDPLVDIVKDTTNIFSLATPIKNPDGTIYTGNGPLYARARFFINGEYKEWIEFDLCSPDYLNSLDDADRESLLSESLNQNIY